MKKVLLSISLSICLALGAFAQTTPQSAANDNPNAPVLEFANIVHDYGTIVKGGDGTCEFKFTNKGIEPLILTNAQASCGCTVPDWPHEPILKGKSAVIKVKYDTQRLGMILKTITVTSNAKNGPIQLTIKGNVIEAPANTPVKNVNAASTPVAK